MMKRLLSMAVAAVFAVGAYAQDYVYTSTQKLKITGDNIVTNGNFAEGTTGWVAADGGDVNATIWTLESGVGPAGESALKSNSNDAADANALCQRWPELSGTYVITLQMKGDAYTNTAIGAADNSVDFFLNTDGAYVKATSTEEAPVVNVATASYFAEDWTTLTFVANVEAGQFLVMNIQRLATNAMVTNIQIRPAEAVYDTRGVEQTIAFAKKLMDDANFNTEAAAAKRAELAETIELVEGMLATGMLDDESTALAYVEILNTVYKDYLDVTSVDLTKTIPGLDITAQAYYGRAGIGNRAATYKLDLSGNWGHLDSEPDALRSAIQNSYDHTATYAAYHEDLPAGKYFFTCEIRNANTDKTSWPCVLSYNAETTCKLFVGKDTIEVGPIRGEEYQQYYLIADIAEAGTVRAGMEWPGVGKGGAVMVRNTQMRAFDLDVDTKVEHIQAYKTYKTQWDAAIDAQKKLRELIGDPNYPWGQDSLARAGEQWSPYVSAQASLNWLTADGADALVATTEQFLDWANYQGVEEYGEPAEEGGEPVRKQYSVVRGFQNASNYVINRNKPFTDLANAIDEAKATRNNSANATGDRETYKTAILSALNTITTVRAATTNATFEADSTTIAQAKEALDAATAAFLASAVVAPIIDIDFESEVGIEAVTIDETPAYVYNGTKGQMIFSGTPVLYEAEVDGVKVKPATTDNNFNIGHRPSQDADLLVPGVLRVGNGTGTVAIAEADQPTDAEMIQFSFDIYFGNLSGKNTYVELRNAANERVAGFSLNRYNGSVAFNEFNDVLTNGGVGMNLLKYATGVGAKNVENDQIAAATNKSSFELVIDYSNQTVKGIINNAKNGKCEGAEIPFSSLTSPAVTSGDTKITQFVIGSSYNNSGRRSWFDNLRAVKFSKVDFEEDITQSPWAEIPDGIQAIGVEKGMSNAIYTLSGVKVTNASKPGIYILNGKKFVVK